jgi:hypothetical protein
MRLKSYLAIVAFLVSFSLVGAQVSFADDSGPMPEFLLKNDKIICVSVTDLENVSKDYFFVFDYSSATAQKMGKPWTVIEPGKCYQIDSDENDVYRVQAVNGDELQKFSDYSAYPLAASVPSAFCHSDQRYNPCRQYSVQVKQPDGTSKSYNPITQAYILDSNSVTLSREENLRSEGDLQSLLPLRYSIGYPLTFGISMGTDNGFDKFIHSDSYSQLRDLYSSLTTEFNAALNVCDRRSRIEYQYEIKPSRSAWGDETFLSLKNEVWRFEDGHTVSAGNTQESLYGLNVIQSIGCSTTLQKFIDDHESDIKKMDDLTEEANKLLEQLRTKYPPYSPLNSVDIVEKSSPKVPKKIGDTATTSNITNNALVPIETTLDQVSPEQKEQIFINEGGVFTKIYFYLPIFALIGMTLFLARRLWK